MAFQPGLQTHFPNGRIEPRYLDQVRARVYWCRMDAQHGEREWSLEIYHDILATGRRPLIICWDGFEAGYFPPADLEYQNERSITLGDVPALPGREYRENWDRDFWPAVQAGGHRGYFGAAANFEDRDLDWYRDADAGSLPPEVICTIHDYWDRSFPTLASRVRKWRDIIGRDRSYLISECGVNHSSPEGIAEYMAKKWNFWQQQERCLGLVYFQIFDDVVNQIPMGLYQGQPGFGEPQVKQVVFDTFPLVHEEHGADPMPTNFCISLADSIAQPDGTYTYQYPNNPEMFGEKAGKVLSVQPDGSEALRDAGTAGAYEKYTREGDRAVYRPVAGVAYGYPLVN